MTDKLKRNRAVNTMKSQMHIEYVSEGAAVLHNGFNEQFKISKKKIHFFAVFYYCCVVIT